MKRFAMFFSFVVLVAVALTGCKKDSDSVVTPPVTGSTTYVGTLANAAETGSMTLTFSSAIGKLAPTLVQNAESLITVNGSIKIGSTTIPITGTYNTTTDSIFISGGGYTFTGKLHNGHITGSYTGPNGPGGFSASPSSSEGSVKVYCGTSHETSPDTSSHGRFNLVITGTSVSGITDDGLELSGTVNGTNISISINVGGTLFPIATGVIEGTSLHGNYSFSGSEGTVTGTWEASPCP